MQEQQLRGVSFLENSPTNVKFGDKRLSELLDPIENTDAATKQYVDDNAGGESFPEHTDTVVQFGDRRLTELLGPVVDTDAATKKYVDDNAGGDGSGHSSMLTPQDYGAAADGQIDDSKSIQDAIDSITDNGILYFPPGKYRIASTVTVPLGNIKLLGSGPGSIIYSDVTSINVLLDIAGDPAYTTNNVGDPPVQNRHIEGLNFSIARSNMNQTIAVRCNNNHQTNIVNCYFGDFFGPWSNAFDPNRWSYINLIGIKGTRVNNCIFSHNHAVQIYQAVVIDTDIDDLIISNNDFSYVYSDVISLQMITEKFQGKNTICNNVIEECVTGYSLVCANGYTTTISGNAFSESHTKGGIYLSGCSGFTITGDTIIDCNLTQSGQITVDASSAGIKLVSTSNCTLTGNTSGNSGSHAGTNGKIFGYQNYGIWIDGNSDNNTITGNNLTKNEIDGLLIASGAVDNVISANSVESVNKINYTSISSMANKFIGNTNAHTYIRAYMSNAQTFSYNTSGSFTTIAYDNETHDLLGEYNNSVYTFVPALSGLYSFTAGIIMNGLSISEDGIRFTLSLFVNGTRTVDLLETSLINSTNPGLSGTTMHSVNTGEAITFRIRLFRYAGSNGTITAYNQPNTTYLNIVRIM